MINTRKKRPLAQSTGGSGFLTENEAATAIIKEEDEEDQPGCASSASHNCRPSESEDLTCCGVSFISRTRLFEHEQLVHSKVTGAIRALEIKSRLPPRIIARSRVGRCSALPILPAAAVPNYKFKGISCSHCSLEIYGSERSVYLQHVLDHFAPPRYLQRQKYRCKLCVMGVTQWAVPNLGDMGVKEFLEHYSTVHPNVSLSQVFVSHDAAKSIFAFLNTCIEKIYAKNALNVWSLIDRDWKSYLPLAQATLFNASTSVDTEVDTISQSKYKNIVVKTKPDFYRCERCKCAVGRPLLSQHIVNHILWDTAATQEIEERQTVEQIKKAQFQCLKCQNKRPFFKGIHACQLALVHALQNHHSVKFSDIYSPKGSALLLKDYLVSIVESLFRSDVVDQVSDIIVNAKYPSSRDGGDCFPDETTSYRSSSNDDPDTESRLCEIFNPKKMRYNPTLIASESDAVSLPCSSSIGSQQSDYCASPVERARTVKSGPSSKQLPRNSETVTLIVTPEHDEHPYSAGGSANNSNSAVVKLEAPDDGTNEIVCVSLRSEMDTYEDVKSGNQ